MLDWDFPKLAPKDASDLLQTTFLGKEPGNAQSGTDC